MIDWRKEDPTIFFMNIDVMTNMQVGKCHTCQRNIHYHADCSHHNSPIFLRVWRICWVYQVWTCELLASVRLEWLKLKMDGQNLGLVSNIFHITSCLLPPTFRVTFGSCCLHFLGNEIWNAFLYHFPTVEIKTTEVNVDRVIVLPNHVWWRFSIGK